MNCVEIENLCKSYGDFSLKNISFCVPEGCVVGLIGENGAGKTTTIKCILSAVKADGGTVKVFGKLARELGADERARIGVVTGGSGLPSNLSVKQVEKAMRGIFRGWSGESFCRYAEKFNLSADKKVRELSGGMKQKLALAVALSHESDLLILDEPTTGLDPVARDDVLEEFYEYIQRENRSVLITSHITGDLEKICDYIAFIHNGALLFFEEKDKLYEKYGIVRGDMASINRLGKDAVVAYTASPYGASALALKEKLPKGVAAERAGIEDIMLYVIKGEKL